MTRRLSTYIDTVADVIQSGVWRDSQALNANAVREIVADMVHLAKTEYTGMEDYD